MFGLSLTKLLFTVGAIAAVWKVFRYFEAKGKAKLHGAGAPEQVPSAIEELVECTVCATYMPVSGTVPNQRSAPSERPAPCERPDCPYLP